MACSLNKTIAKHEEIELYKAAGTSSFGGVSYEDSEDWRQYLRLTSQTDTLCSKLIKDMQASIDRIDQESRTLADMATSAVNPELGEVYGDEQRKNEQLRSILKEDIEAIKDGPTVPVRLISEQEAPALEKIINHSVDSLQGEFTLHLSRYADWLTSACAINTLCAAVA